MMSCAWALGGLVEILSVTDAVKEFHTRHRSILIRCQQIRIVSTIQINVYSEQRIGLVFEAAYVMFQSKRILFEIYD